MSTRALYDVDVTGLSPSILYEMGRQFATGGKELPKDESAALELYRMAAEDGHVDAMLALAKLYSLRGDRKPSSSSDPAARLPEYAEAVRWYRKRTSGMP